MRESNDSTVGITNEKKNNGLLLFTYLDQNIVLETLFD